MQQSKANDMKHGEGFAGMETPSVVSQQEWTAAREQLLAKEKEMIRARDALAAKRRQMPWMAVENKYRSTAPTVK